jgi:signal transduction histidine kinase
MWTSTLRRLRPADTDVQRAAQAIAHAVNLERRLIEELLDLSRLERGTLETYRETFDLREVVRGVVDERTASATEAELTLECNFPAKPVRVHVDRTRLSQVLHAVVENSIKFVSAGGRIHVELARNATRAEIVVVDSGPGIPADVLAQLFTPFVKGRNARGGLGLGLALARRLLELHGGTIDAGSPASGGARVVVSLPLA